MASYQGSPDLKSLLINPVQSLNREVMSTIGARSQYYIQSLQQIKSAHDSVFDMNLSNEQNIQSLNQQKQEADNKLKDVVKNDLSIGEHRTEALNLFKPIMQNRNFLLDEQLTSQIQKGFSQAQSDVAKHGADHYNSLSIQAMNNTMKKWRNEDPNNIEGYLNDSLGTTYQPYDPKISQQFYKDLDIHLKKETVKNETPGFQIGDAVYIRTDTGTKMNKLEADEYIRSIIPQQEQIQEQLKARVDLDDYSELAKKSPEAANMVVEHFNALKNFSIQSKKDHATEMINSLELQKSLIPATDANSDALSTIKTNIENYKKYRDVDIPTMYKDFDDNAYIDPNKRKLAQAQASSLYLDRKVNGIVNSMGIGKIETTYKQDAAATSAKNLEFNRQKLASSDYWKKLELQQKMMKDGQKFDEEGNIVPINPATAANPNIHSSDIVAQAETPEEKAKVIQETVENKNNALEQDVNSNLLTQLRAVVQSPNGSGNIDVLSYMKTIPGNTPFKDVIDQIRGGDDAKELIRSLVTNVYDPGKGKVYNKEFFDNQPISSIIPRILTMLSNRDVFDQAAMRAGVDQNKLSSVASQLVSSRGMLDNQRQNDYKNYGKIYENASKVLGVPVPKDASVFNYSSDQYVNDISGQLKGFSSQEKENLKKYLRGETFDSSSAIVADLQNQLRNPYRNPERDGAILSRIQSIQSDMSKFDVYKGKWDEYKKQVTEGYKGKTGTSFNANVLRLSVASPERAGSDKFNPQAEISQTNVLNLLDKASGNNPLTGTINPTATAFLKWKSAGLMQPKYIQNIVLADEGTNSPYLKIEVNDASDSELKKAFDDKADDPSGLFNGVSWDDFKKQINSAKIYIPKEEVQKYMGVQSPYAVALRNGNDIGYNLPSKKADGSANHIYVRDIGTTSPNVVVQGSAKLIKREGPSNFSIADRDLSSPEEFSRLTNISPSTLVNNPPAAVKGVTDLDVVALRLSQILERNNVKLDKNGQFDFKSLPLKVKEQILKDKDLKSIYFSDQTIQ